MSDRAATDPPDDAALVRDVLRAGSEPAFRLLYRRHEARLYRLARRLVSADADAEDVVQETWLRAVDRLPSFEGRAALGTWLCGIAVNVAREQLSRRGAWDVWDAECSDTHVERPDRAAAAAAAADVATRLDVERALTTLPPRCRAVFLLHDVEGFTHEEIAAQLGCTAGTSKTQLFRARRALRRLLGDTPDDSEEGPR